LCCNKKFASCKRATKNKRVGVIGTSATIGSHSYKKRLTEEDPEIKVFEQDCPLFVPLVENGFIDKNDPIVLHLVRNQIHQ